MGAGWSKCGLKYTGSGMILGEMAAGMVAGNFDSSCTLIIFYLSYSNTKIHIRIVTNHL